MKVSLEREGNKTSFDNIYPYTLFISKGEGDKINLTIEASDDSICDYIELTNTNSCFKYLTGSEVIPVKELIVRI
jgi:hypothetical protein